jgi:hypothetical protein
MLTGSQIDGWQTATRPDLTGPYSPTSNTNSAEAPAVAANGFVAGQRMTIGDPGAPGLNVVRVGAEVFESDDTADLALQQYVRDFASLGYSNQASAGNLPSPATAMSGGPAFIAPQFALGSAAMAYAFVWRISNLVVVVRAGGDDSVTNDQALRWASLVESIIPKR